MHVRTIGYICVPTLSTYGELDPFCRIRGDTILVHRVEGGQNFSAQKSGGGQHFSTQTSGGDKISVHVDFRKTPAPTHKQ